MKTWLIVLIIILCILIVWYIFSKIDKKELPVVNVDLNRYIGKWVEIVRSPFNMENKCSYPTAYYQLGDDNTLKITNSCYEGDRNQSVNLVATPRKDPIIPGTLIYPGTFNVNFYKCHALCGDYNVLYLDKDYTVSLVGTMDRKHFWIISRDYQIDTQLIDNLIAYAKSLGFDTNNLIYQK